MLCWGASWAGIKSMTATSGPGFSLMMENLGLGIMLETPCVLVNVQRGGPSTGLPGEISEDPETRDLHLLVENTTSNRLESHIFDMLVLAVGAVPGRNTETIRQMVSLSKSPSGFLREAHPKLRPVDTPTKGVFIAGGAESPKDVRESVTQASAAASRAAILLNKDEFSVDAITAVVEEDLCKLCGICADVCPFSAITWQKGQLAEVITAACTGCGTCAAECKFNAIA